MPSHNVISIGEALAKKAKFSRFKFIINYENSHEKSLDLIRHMFKQYNRDYNGYFIIKSISENQFWRYFNLINYLISFN